MTKVNKVELYAEHNSIPPHVCFIPDSDKPKQRIPTAIKWSGSGPVPKVGATINCGNGIGKGLVLRYFTEHGWLGVVAMPENPPAWYIKQNGRFTTCHMFGAEIDGK